MTGYYGGGIFVLPGREGGFGSPEPLLGGDGRPLRAGQYWDEDGRQWHAMQEPPGIAVTPVDWDGDGDQDLLLGASDGSMVLRLNEGSPEKARFSTDNLLLDVRVPGRHAMPAVADWDGDGRFDLISGSYSGAVWWFRNIGEAGEPRFEEARQLVGPDGAPHGHRTQVAAQDFDGDGDVDLLVGDHRVEAHGEGGRRTHGFVWLYRRELPAAIEAPADGARGTEVRDGERPAAGH